MKFAADSVATAVLACSILLMAGPAHAKKAIEYAEMNILSPLPELAVTGQGGSYDQVAGNTTLTFGAEARGRCLWAHAYKSITYRLTASAAQFQYVSDGLTWKYISDDNANRDRTWSSSMTPISIGWAPNQGVKTAAIQACNSQRQNKGGKAFSLTMNDQVWSQFSFQCADLAGTHGVLAETRTIIKPHPITVNCAALVAPTPTPTVPMPATVQATPLTIGQVTVAANPKNHRGPCPAVISFNGAIQTSGNGGELNYRFLNNEQPLSPWQKLVVAAGKQSNAVSAQFTAQTPAQQEAPQPPALGIQGQGVQPKPQLTLAPTETIQLQVQYQGQNRSATDQYVVNCQTPKQGTATLVTRPTVSGLPDLTSQEGITIGQQSAPWGGVINLTPADATASTPRGCQYRMKYDVANIGEQDAKGVASRLSATGQLHMGTGLEVGKGESRNVSGNILLAAGTHLVRADIDPNKQVAESNEGNNSFRVTVNVPENCGADSPATRGREEPRRPQ
jgi:hypothetical protein